MRSGHRTRKVVTMVVVVTVPAAMSAKDARREVRELIRNQCNWSADLDQIKPIAVTPAPKDLRF